MSDGLVEIDTILMEIELELLNTTGYISENALSIIESEEVKRNGK